MKEAIVLAGGLGTRLRSVVPDLPKPLAPVAGRPFLDILLAFLEAQGFSRVILSTGHRAELVEQSLGTSRGRLQLDYCVEAEPLGTGGAIAAALPRCAGDHAFVFNGDTYLDVDTAAVEALWQAHHQPVIVVREVADTSRFGRITLHAGRVGSFGGAPSTGPGFINAGCYLLPTTLLQGRTGPPRFSFENDFLAHEVTRQPFRGFVTRGRFIDIGVPEDYARAQTELAGLWP